MNTHFFTIIILLLALTPGLCRDKDELHVFVSNEPAADKFHYVNDIVPIDFLEGEKTGIYISVREYVKYLEMDVFIDASRNIFVLYAPSYLFNDPYNDNEKRKSICERIRDKKEKFLSTCVKQKGKLSPQDYKFLVDFVQQDYPKFSGFESGYDADIMYHDGKGKWHGVDFLDPSVHDSKFENDPLLEPVRNVHRIIKDIWGNVKMDQCQWKNLVGG